jgi:hypothetical protein
MYGTFALDCAPTTAESPNGCGFACVSFSVPFALIDFPLNVTSREIA